MSEPGDKACAQPLPVIGEGCLSRYDPEALDEQHGTEFPGAQALWEQEKASIQATDARLPRVAGVDG